MCLVPRAVSSVRRYEVTRSEADRDAKRKRKGEKGKGRGGKKVGCEGLDEG